MKTLLLGCGCLLTICSLAAGQPPEVSVMDLVEQSQAVTVKGDFEQGMRLAREAVTLDPAYAMGWKQLGLVQARRGRFAEACRVLETARDLEPADAAIQLELARCCWEGLEQERALAAMQTYLENQGHEDAGAWRDYARWQADKDRLRDAVDAMEQALRADPLDASAWRDFGNWLWDLGEQGEALDAYDQALELNVTGKQELALRIAASLFEKDEAALALSRAQAWIPDLDLVEAGQALRDLGRLKGAEGFLQEAWLENPDHYETALMLAHVRAQLGRCTGTDALIERSIEPVLEDGTPDDIAKLLECLAICGSGQNTASTLTRIEAAIGHDEPFRQHLSDAYEKGAVIERNRGQAESAQDLFSKAFELYPDRSTWMSAYRVTCRVHGDEAGASFLEDLSRRVTRPELKSGILGQLAEYRGQDLEAEHRYQESIQLKEDQPDIQQALFNLQVRQGRYDEARRILQWFNHKLDTGSEGYRSYTAEMLDTLGESRRAMEAWHALHLASPHVPYYATQAARMFLENCRPEEAVATLEGALAYSDDPRLFEMLAEVEMALDHPAAALAYARQGLEHTPTPNLHRIFSESAEAAGMINADQPEIGEQVLESVQTYLDADPGYESMALLGGRTLVSLNRTNDAVVYYVELLERNPACIPAIKALRDLCVLQKDFNMAEYYANRLQELQPWDIEARRKQAVTEAEQREYHQALDSLKDLQEHDPAQSVSILMYRNITPCPYAGRNSVEQISDHLDFLESQGYRYLTPPELASAKTEKNVMLVILDANADVFEAIDRLLESRQGAVAVYAGNNELLEGKRPGSVSTERLLEGDRAGRWFIASSGPAAFARVPVAPAGFLGNPLTHRLYGDGSAEQEKLYEVRIASTVSNLAEILPASHSPTLVYPRGDYGQVSLDTEEPAVSTFEQVVKGRFDYAVYADDLGFVPPDCDPIRLPGKMVPAGWTGDDLAEHLRQKNPLVRTRVDLAKVHYWSRQHEKANELFRELEASGADPGEVYFNWGANAFMEGDLPTALSRLRRAQDYWPDYQPIEKVLQKAHLQTHPLVLAGYRYWEDSEDRDWESWYAEGGFHPVEALKLGVAVSRERWRTENIPQLHANRIQLPFRYYPLEETWFQGRAWLLDLEEMDNRIGGVVNLHVPYTVIGGFAEFQYTHEEISTREALRAEIDADEYMLKTYSRIHDSWELFLNGWITDRDDENTTEGFRGTIDCRLNEKPFFAAGYRTSYADSDTDPAEYWAPIEYREHLLYLALRGSYTWLSFLSSLETGIAREKGTDWEDVFGCKLDATASVIQDRAYIGGVISWFDGPRYERLYAGLEARVRF